MGHWECFRRIRGKPFLIKKLANFVKVCKLTSFCLLGLASLLAGKTAEENVRNVERGSKIITAITQDTKLILQVSKS